jgi:hypothetical protein
MLQFPFECPPGSEVPPLTHLEQIFGFAVLYLLLLSLISFVLPRPWFVMLFRIVFPFMAGKLERNND